MKITFPDGNVKEFSDGSSGYDIAMGIAEGLARNALGVEVDGTLQDVHKPITTDATVRIITFKDPEGKEMFWHSSAHLLAQAVKRLYPKAKPTIGPPIEQGFYYDFDDLEISQEDFENIEAEMKKIVKEAHATKRKEFGSKEEAKEFFKENPYKCEIIELAEEGLSAYEQGEFVDLCRGPHIPNTKMIKALKLTKMSGAYWRGDAKNKQLTRIYGITFPDKKELNEYLERMEEAKKRDHRRLMGEQQLVMLHEYAPGMPFFLPKGAHIYNQLLAFIREEYHTRGYEEVITPQMFNKKLWETSGHWEHYQDDLFNLDIEGQTFSLKPMNCPSHCLIFKRDSHSYRELPIRIADFCNLHRNELSGTLTGLTRVRKFSQDDAHIFCAMDQVESEVLGVLQFIKYVWEDVFGFKLTYYLSTRPDDKLGDDALWDKSEGMLKAALEKASIPYEIKEGDGAFYGPKIDIDLEDALGRKWQCPTCQLDFNLPERFELEYDGEDGKRHRPVMIHRAVLGSIERFMAIMIEHYAGKFPLWLSPNQVIILPIADRHNEYCDAIAKEFSGKGLQVHVDTRSESTKKKVRDAQVAKWNYILVIGDKEVESKTVNVRTRDEEVLGEKKVDKFIFELQEEIKEKKN